MEWKKLITDSINKAKRKLPFLIIVVFLAGGIPTFLNGFLSLLFYFDISYDISGGSFTLIPFYIIIVISFIGFWFLIGALVYSLKEEGFRESLNQSFKNLHKIIVVAVIFFILSNISLQGIRWTDQYELKEKMVKFTKQPQQSLTKLEIPMPESAGFNPLSIITNIFSILLFSLSFTLPEIMINNSAIFESIKNSVLICRNNVKGTLILFLIVTLLPLILEAIPFGFSFISSTISFIFYLFVNAVAVIINWVIITNFYLKLRES